MASNLGVEQYLTLPDGRTLAYEHNGNPQSTTVVLYFHGTMTVGDAKRLAPGLREKNVHYISPTLPGWGSTSPRPINIPFPQVLCQDTMHLLLLLHPTALEDDNFRLFVAGGSSGTVSAQIVFGAPHDRFPLGPKIKGCLLMGAFVPFYKDPTATKYLTWANWLMVGPPAVNLPFNILPRIMKKGFQGQVGTPEKAQKFIKSFLFDKMSKEEKEAIENAQGRSSEELIRDMGNNVYRSIEKSWEGMMDGPHVINEDWGLRPEVFRSGEGREEQGPRVLAIAGQGDDATPVAFGEWCAKNYRNAELKTFPGGHVAALAHMKEIWEMFLFDVE